MRKEIPDFEGYYADSDGYIYSSITNKKLSGWIDNVGYYQVVLYKNGKRCYKRIHTLIAKTFLTTDIKNPIVNHKDANKLNNKLENLEYVSNSYNTKHGYDNKCYLSTHNVIVIATNKLTGEEFKFNSIRECSRELNLNRKTLTAIIKGNKTNNYDYDFNMITN